MHTSRCVHAGAFMPTIIAPRSGEQTACPANVATPIGTLTRRHALWVTFSDLAGGAPFAVVELQYAGRASVFVTIGGLPFGRVLVSEEAAGCIVTPASNAVVWREEMRDFDPEGCR